MRDWPQVLKLNATAAQLAPALYYARCQLYDVDAPMWVNVSPEIHRSYIDIAQRLLTDLAPKVDLPYLTEPQWCVQCGTRTVSKHYTPFCSHICLFAHLSGPSD